jgi:3-oxocholest-4-en-26-oate---CoA ligase
VSPACFFGRGRIVSLTQMDARAESGWNMADVWETIATRIPDAPAQARAGANGARVVTWAEFDRRADAIAQFLLDAGVRHQDKVAQYLYNCPEYLESHFAAYKAGLVPVNTNYRYGADELVYLWDNADTVAVEFHATFSEMVDDIRGRLPRIHTWIWVDDGSGPCPDWAVDLAAITATAVPAEEPAVHVQGPWGRSGDDLMLLYTGGTTGMPKGVMWRQDDLVVVLDTANRQRLPHLADLDIVGERTAKPGPRNLPAAPLMHGTGLFNAMSNMLAGGCIVTMEGRRFDPVELLDTVERERIASMSIVGDAFAKPVLTTLDEHPGRWDISSLRVIVSSGVMWSNTTKQGLLRHNERLIMVDALGSSEAIGMAQNTTTADRSPTDTARFELGPDTKVLTEDGAEVQPGSGVRGRVALRGRTPIGYYKDAEKSAATFVVIDGQRWSIPGDFAEVDADGSVRLLGRGSQCINTGGEKVYPEEVEEVLKQHPSVADAAVVGIPDERFGHAVAAVVELVAEGAADVEPLIHHVRAHLAHYKAPRRIVFVDTLGRAPNGKLDYRRLGDIAASAI